MATAVTPAAAGTQNLSNHAKFVPLFHFVALPILIVNLFSMANRAIRNPSWDTILGALVALAILLVALLARMFAIKVQDRVIRLEMRLRMRELLPPDLAARIPQFTAGQLVALRFAGDAELPALARKVLDDRMDNRKAIKQLVKDWQGDHLRA